MFSATEGRPQATRAGMANSTPTLGRRRVGANTGRASSSSPMAARSRSMERSRGSASRLFTRVSACRAALLAGVSSAGGGVSISGLPETVLGGAGETVSGKKRRAGSGSGFQPSRRRLFRTVVSLEAPPTSNPSIAHPFGLETKNGRVTGMDFLVSGSSVGGRPSRSHERLRPPTLKRSW